MNFFLCVMGMVAILEGLPYFAFPHKMKRWMHTLLTAPNSALRRMGFVLMLVGLGMVYLGRR
jgi:hypothetical protein